MFGSKKVEDILKPMSGYPSDQLKDIKLALTNKSPHRLTDVKWEDVKTIWIDKIRLNKNSSGRIDFYLRDEPGSDYIKAWNKGLGFFIKKDWKSGENLDKYKFLYFPKSKNFKGLVALLRFIDDEDLIFYETTLDELKKYHALSFSYKDENEEKHVSVLKVFVKSDLLSDEAMLGNYAKIMNILDEYSDDNNEAFYETLFTSLVPDESEETNSGNKSNNQNEEFVNQESLF